MTDAERAALKARIDKALVAYDALITGTAVSKFVDQNGESVEYTKTDLTKLESYINGLNAQLACGSNFRSRGPIGFVF